MGPIKLLKLWRRWTKIKAAYKKEGQMFDVKINLKKALVAFFVTLGGVALAAIAQWLMVSENVTTLLGPFFSKTLVGLIAPLIVAGATSLFNWLKHKDK